MRSAGAGASSGPADARGDRQEDSRVKRGVKLPLVLVVFDLDVTLVRVEYPCERVAQVLADGDDDLDGPLILGDKSQPAPVPLRLQVGLSGDDAPLFLVQPPVHVAEVVKSTCQRGLEFQHGPEQLSPLGALRVLRVLKLGERRPTVPVTGLRLVDEGFDGRSGYHPAP